MTFDDIDPRSPTPIYEQIAARVRVAVAAGDFKPGAALPSVRELSRQLRINPATVVQAYRELESDGFVESRRGAGTFIREVGPVRKEEERERRAQDIASAALQEAARWGIPAMDVLDALRAKIGEDARAGSLRGQTDKDDRVGEEGYA
jgi:GntR family transcriptional regulator